MTKRNTSYETNTQLSNNILIWLPEYCNVFSANKDNPIALVVNSQPIIVVHQPIKTCPYYYSN